MTASFTITVFTIFCLTFGKIESIPDLDDLLPTFDSTTDENMTVQIGQTAYLRCKVKNLGNKKVTWIRRQGAHILTVGRYTFTSDQRIQAVEDTDDWILQIKYALKRDTGTYECQINSEPPISKFFNLEVFGPAATLLGPPDQVVSPGSTIILTCVFMKPDPPDFVNWYHNDTLITNTDDADRITITTTIPSQMTLIITMATPSDSGKYTCHPSQGEAAITMVHVFAETCKTEDLKIANAVYDKTLVEVKNNEEVNVTCREGFGMKSKSVERIRCVKGTWVIRESIVCLSHCLYPVLPPDAQVLNPVYYTYLQNERVFISCSVGYFVFEEAVYPILAMTCLGNNIWEPSHLVCVPKEHVLNIYRPQLEKIVEIDPGEHLTLSCDHQLPTLNETQSASWKWLKDSVDLTSTVINFSISENGSLIIPAVSTNSVGSYTCLLESNSHYITTDTVYTVKLRTPCFNSAPNATMVAEEKTYTILICPKASIDSYFTPTWYDQDGRRIFNDERFGTIFNSDLLIKSVHRSDEGLYICDRGLHSPFCERRFTYYLQVNGL